MLDCTAVNPQTQTNGVLASSQGLPLELLNERCTRCYELYHETRENYMFGRCVECRKLDRTEYRVAHPDRMRTYARRASLKRFGLTERQYDALLRYQKGVCAICHKVCSSGKKLAVDHNHATGQVRGLLCHKCNRAIGLLGDSLESAQRATDYLQRAKDLAS